MKLCSPNSKRVLLLVVVLMLPIFSVQAHESRPGYLEVNQTAPDRYDVLWRTPLNAGMRLPVVLRFSDEMRNVTEPKTQELNDSLIERRTIEVAGGLVGKRIEFVGLVHRWSWGQKVLRLAGGCVAVAGLIFMWRAVS